MIKIIETAIGSFPEVDRLNPRFLPDSQRLKLTIDMTDPPAHYLENFPHLYYKLMEIFPNLRRHHCSSGGEMDGFRDVNIVHPDLPIRIVGGVIDTAHIFEHLIIELQCSLAKMPMCSGITCSLWEPENRFDVFVECESAAMGNFAGRLGVEIINDVIDRGAMSSAPRRMVQIVPLLLDAPDLNATGLAQQLEWSTTVVHRTLKELRDHEFPFHGEAVGNR